MKYQHKNAELCSWSSVDLFAYSRILLCCINFLSFVVMKEPW